MYCIVMVHEKCQKYITIAAFFKYSSPIRSTVFLALDLIGPLNTDAPVKSLDYIKRATNNIPVHRYFMTCIIAMRQKIHKTET